MKNGTDFDVVGLHRVEDQMGLEAETSIAWSELVHLLANQREIGEESEGTDQAGVISFGLIFAKPAFGEVVDVDQVGSGTLR